MQYKIPVQIENDDPIFLWLSLKQLGILILWWVIAYMLFKSLAGSWVPIQIAAIPAIVIIIIVLVIVLFKHSWMTFIPFILNVIRLNLNSDPKKWENWIDSFTPLEIWYVTKYTQKKKEKFTILSKKDKLKLLEDKLNKI